MSKCSEAVLPTRSQINPNEIKHILPHIAMMDVIDDGKDFRVRLIGSEVQRYLGRDCTGELLSEGQDFERKFLTPWFQVLLKEKAVIVGSIDSRDEDMNVSASSEIISMPLMNAKNSSVAIILSVLVRVNHWTALVPVQKKILPAKISKQGKFIADVSSNFLS
ncbi:MAG: PAS domain-containing protein [Spirochaetes bacterium]|nr:PAS domain-containing protein [Spirochaetota bacterium]